MQAENRNAAGEACCEASALLRSTCTNRRIRLTAPGTSTTIAFAVANETATTTSPHRGKSHQRWQHKHGMTLARLHLGSASLTQKGSLAYRQTADHPLESLPGYSRPSTFHNTPSASYGGDGFRPSSFVNRPPPPPAPHTSRGHTRRQSLSYASRVEQPRPGLRAALGFRLLE